MCILKIKIGYAYVCHFLVKQKQKIRMIFQAPCFFQMSPVRTPWRWKNKLKIKLKIPNTFIDKKLFN